MLVESPDGTLYGPDGKVVHFSVQRFRRDVVEGGCCFMCGRAESEQVPFNDEHIIPQWILRRYRMYDQQIQLPNGGSVKYSRYKVQCCAECNWDLGKKVEDKTIALLDGSFNDVMARMTRESRELLYCWCALLFLKVHLKDLELRWHPDRRKGDQVIGDAFSWSSMHHIQSLARCPLVGAKLGFGGMGTLFMKRAAVDAAGENYDQGDFSFAYTTMVQINEVAIFAVLNDCQMCERVTRERFDKLGTLSRIQFREMGAFLGYTNLRIEESPKFMTSYARAAGELTVEAEVPQQFRVQGFVPDNFGKMFEFATRDAPLTPEQRAQVRSGLYSYTFDEHKNFVPTPPPSPPP